MTARDAKGENKEVSARQEATTVEEIMVGGTSGGNAGLASNVLDNIIAENMMRVLPMSMSSQFQPSKLEGRLLSQEFLKVSSRDHEECGSQRTKGTRGRLGW